MNQSDQRLYKIVYTGNGGFYNVTADGKCIAKSISNIEQISIAVFCDYTRISEHELFIEDTKVIKNEKYGKILTNLNSMFVAVKMKRNLKAYKFCGLSISGYINESTRSASV